MIYFLIQQMNKSYAKKTLGPEPRAKSLTSRNLPTSAL
jgi:hypothetical protein